MQGAVRSYKTMGVALVGAGVVAASPLAPPMPHIQAVQRAVSSAGVELDAMVNPIEQWQQVLQAAGANLGTIAQAILDNPTPILSQVIANQTASAQEVGAATQSYIQQIQQNLQALPGNLQTAQAQLQAGNITGAVTTLNDGLVVPIVTAVLAMATLPVTPLANMAQEFGNVMATLPTSGDSPSVIMNSILPLTYPLVSAVNELAQSAQDVVTAPSAAVAVNALVNAPANLVNGLLNGDGTLLGFLPQAGLLTPFDPIFGALDSGPIAVLNNMREVIAEALGATPPATTASLAVKAPAAISAIASVPTASKMLTLAATPSTATAAAAATTTATKPSRLHPTKGVSDGTRKASKHAGDGSTNAAAGTDAKHSSTSTGGSKSSAGG